MREPLDREPLEVLPLNVEHPFELDLLNLKIVHNLCGGAQSLSRADVVADTDATTDDKRTLVDRQIALYASTSDVEYARRDLVIHCYVTRQHMLATENQQPHPNLVRLHGHFEFQQTLHVLTEYYASGSLSSAIFPADAAASKTTSTRFQSERDVIRAAQQLCAAVAFLHEECVAHMDVSLETIFVDATGSLRLGGFGHAVFVGRAPQLRRPVVAPTPVCRSYAAPELDTGRQVDLLKVDAWSVGIVLAMVLTRQTPLEEATTQNAHYRLLQVLGVPAFLERLVQDTGPNFGNFGLQSFMTARHHLLSSKISWRF